MYNKYQPSQIEKSQFDGMLAKQRQILHDIKSPLATLDSLAVLEYYDSESFKKLLSQVAQRIREIVNDLSDEVFINSGKCLYQCVLEVIKEKEIEYSDNEKINIKLTNSIVNRIAIPGIDAGYFKRMFSNLINNSVEALESEGMISVYIAIENKNLSLVITDNGKGIPKDMIPLLTQKGFSYAKQRGSGLGLFDANEKIKQWGGQISISSELRKGTQVQINLPVPSITN